MDLADELLLQADLEAEEADPGFAGTNQAWARMNATAQATGDAVRAWVAAFTGSTENAGSLSSSTSSISWTTI